MYENTETLVRIRPPKKITVKDLIKAFRDSDKSHVDPDVVRIQGRLLNWIERHLDDEEVPKFWTPEEVRKL